MRELWNRLVALFRKRSTDYDLEREIQFHLDMKTLETGDPGAARRAVGSPLAWREQGRDVWGWRWLDETVRDVHFAIRGIRTSPGFAAAAILTLGLGIGANCLMFSVVDATLLRPLPFREPERLVFVSGKYKNSTAMPSNPMFQQWRAHSDIFEDVAAWTWRGFRLRGEAYPEQLTGQIASVNFPQVLGIQAELGRTFLPGEELPGHDHVVLISDHLWRTRFVADPGVIGSTMVEVGRTPASFTIVGVLPPTIQEASGELGDVWKPMLRDENQGGNLFVVGKLKKGLSFQAAQNARPTDASPLRPFADDLIRIGVNPRAMRMLSVAVALVLLIACVSVANLMLARGAERVKELTMRAALGAGRARLVRQLVTESLVLGLTGGAVGVVLAYASLDSVKALMPQGLFRGDTVAIDTRTLAFTLAISLGAGVLFGLFPAFRAARVDPRAGLLGVRSAATEHGFVRSGLIVAEIALSLVLLAGAGLMTKSFLGLLWKDLGFDRQNVLALSTGLPLDIWNQPDLRISLEQQVARRLQSVPGVQHVGLSDFRPVGTGMMPVSPHSPSGPPRRAILSGVSPDFFDAMGIPVRAGRRFTDQDRPGAEDVVIVNELAARAYWPDENPIGQSLMLQSSFGKPEVARTVVGVVGDTVGMELAKQRGPIVFVPHAQQLSGSGLNIVVRVAPGISAASLAPALRTELAAIDPTMVVPDVATMQSVIGKQLAQPRFLTVVLGIFASLALLLSITGILGVVAYLVRARSYEFGVRMALGASPAKILRLILTYGARLAAIGVVIGLAGALALSRLLASFLNDVQPRDPVTMATVPLVVLATVLVACYIPARRAMRIDPVQSLRHD